MNDITTQRLRNLVAEHLGFCDDLAKIAPESSFRDDLGMDSIDIVDLAMTVEDELNITLTDDEISCAMGEGDFGRLIELVEVKVAKREAV